MAYQSLLLYGIPHFFGVHNYNFPDFMSFFTLHQGFTEVAIIPLWWSTFAAIEFHVGFVVDIMALGKFHLTLLQFQLSQSHQGFIFKFTCHLLLLVQILAALPSNHRQAADGIAYDACFIQTHLSLH